MRNWLDNWSDNWSAKRLTKTTWTSLFTMEYKSCENLRKYYVHCAKYKYLNKGALRFSISTHEKVYLFKMVILPLVFWPSLRTRRSTWKVQFWELSGAPIESPCLSIIFLYWGKWGQSANPYYWDMCYGWPPFIVIVSMKPPIRSHAFSRAEGATIFLAYRCT